MKKLLSVAAVMLLSVVGMSAQTTSVENHRSLYVCNAFAVELVGNDYYLVLPPATKVGTLRLPILYAIAPVQWNRTRADWSNPARIHIGSDKEKAAEALILFSQKTREAKKGYSFSATIGGEELYCAAVKSNKVVIRCGDKATKPIHSSCFAEAVNVLRK